MIGPITSSWAKLLTDSSGNTLRDTGGAPVAWHPLSHHCADVAAVMLALLDQTVVRRWLAALDGQQELPPVHRQRLAYFAAIHDMGKVNLGFQNRRHHPPRQPTAGHVGPMLQLLNQSSPEARRMLAAIRWAEVENWFTTAENAADLLRTAICHHGRPVQPEGGPSLSLWRVSCELDPLLEAERLAAAAQDWLPLAFEDDASFLRAGPQFQHGFNGLLTLADWIASDTSLFNFSDSYDADRFAWALTHSSTVLRSLGIDVSGQRSSLGRARPTFASIAEGDPRELQARMLALPAEPGGGITVLEAETGAGKTEAAIARFMSLFHAGEVDGLYFALPTRTAATQIHRRVHRSICRAFPDEHDRPPVVLAVPGYLAVDDSRGLQVSRFAVRWPDQSKGWRGRGWAAEHSKRFLAGSVVVGTIDQVLLSALSVGHAHMRAAALARHFIVVDEVHASDAYMNTVLEAVLARHVNAGGHALLMSATLGAAARERLLRPRRFAALSPPEEAVAVPYPLVTHAAPRITDLALIPLKPSVGRRISVQLSRFADAPNVVARLALEAAAAGARVLVIRNTVADCVATQSAVEALSGEAPASDNSSGQRPSVLLRCRGVAAPHHSRFSREDRQALDDAIETTFGKESTSEGVVAVATQTVQQSLDLDADLLITDLCPADVLLQRIGRLHRHKRTRPSPFDMPQVLLLLPEERDLGMCIRRDGSARGPHGFGTVYSDLRVLEATWQQFEQQPVIEIPSMARSLVEATTHPAVLQAICEGRGGAWARHNEWVIGVLLAHCRMAAGHLVEWDRPFPDAAFPSEGTRVGSRLGAEDRVVEFDPPVPAESSPFANPVSRLGMPHWLVERAEVDADPTNVRELHGAVEFAFGAGQYVYDRLGLRKLNDASTTAEEDDG
jgi:CRISPR-associated endonuclease/helicase Cas3